LTNEQKRIAQMYHLTFSTESGQQVLQDMLASYGGQTYVQGDTHQTAFNEGQRSVPLAIQVLLDLVNHGQEGEVEQPEGD
jgi:hypothetical protein